MTPQDTMRLALEALEAAEFHVKRRIPDASIEVAVRPAIEALKAALPQQVEQPVAFDYQTAADFLNGKTINGELVSRFVSAARWAHDDNRSLRSAIQSLRGELAARDAEIAMLKNALMEAEATPAAQHSCDQCESGGPRGACSRD